MNPKFIIIIIAAAEFITYVLKSLKKSSVYLQVSRHIIIIAGHIKHKTFGASIAMCFMRMQQFIYSEFVFKQNSALFLFSRELSTRVMSVHINSM